MKPDIRDILKQLCAYQGVEIIEGYLKGKSALMIFDNQTNLKHTL